MDLLRRLRRQKAFGLQEVLVLSCVSLEEAVESRLKTRE